MNTSECEQSLLGSLLVDQSQFAAIAGTIAAADFADADYGRLFEALANAHDAGTPLDDVRLLVPELRRAGLPDNVTAAHAIGRMIQNAIAGHARYYALEIRRGSDLRREAAIGSGLIARAADPQANPAEIAAWADASLAALGKHHTDEATTIADVAQKYLNALRQPRTKQACVMSGLLPLDETVGGWLPGELVVLAARPGQGKTALALQIAAHITGQRRPALFCSLEMRDVELIGRLLCGHARINSRAIRTGRYDDRDIGHLEWSAAKLAENPLYVWAPHRTATRRLRAIAKRTAASGGLALLIVDYLNLLQADDPRRPRTEQIAQITGDLKALAKELDVPVLALCQLNREAEQQEPRLSNLRESGAIEQDADVVLLLHRPDPRDTATRLIVAKHRHGDTGAITLRFIPERTIFAAATHELSAF